MLCRDLRIGPSTKASQLVSPLPTWPLQFTFLAGASRSLENMDGVHHSPAETFHGFPVVPKSKFKLLPCPVRADQCGPCLSDSAPPPPPRSFRFQQPLLYSDTLSFFLPGAFALALYSRGSLFFSSTCYPSERPSQITLPKTALPSLSLSLCFISSQHISLLKVSSLLSWFFSSWSTSAPRK